MYINPTRYSHALSNHSNPTSQKQPSSYPEKFLNTVDVVIHLWATATSCARVKWWQERRGARKSGHVRRGDWRTVCESGRFVRDHTTLCGADGAAGRAQQNAVFSKGKKYTNNVDSVVSRFELYARPDLYLETVRKWGTCAWSLIVTQQEHGRIFCESKWESKSNSKMDKPWI